MQASCLLEIEKLGGRVGAPRVWMDQKAMFQSNRDRRNSPAERPALLDALPREKKRCLGMWKGGEEPVGFAAFPDEVDKWGHPYSRRESRR